MLGEMVLHPAGEGDAFLPEYVDSEKANLIDKIRGEINDKLQYALSRLRSQMCQGEAYGVNRYGSEESAQTITGEALYQRYRTLLETAPMYLYYCGSAGAGGAGVPGCVRRAAPNAPAAHAPDPGPGEAPGRSAPLL